MSRSPVAGPRIHGPPHQDRGASKALWAGSTMVGSTMVGSTMVGSNRVSVTGIPAIPQRRPLLMQEANRHSNLHKMLPQIRGRSGEGSSSSSSSISSSSPCSNQAAKHSRDGQLKAAKVQHDPGSRRSLGSHNSLGNHSRPGSRKRSQLWGNRHSKSSHWSSHCSPWSSTRSHSRVEPAKHRAMRTPARKVHKFPNLSSHRNRRRRRRRRHRHRRSSSSSSRHHPRLLQPCSLDKQPSGRGSGVDRQRCRMVERHRRFPRMGRKAKALHRPREACQRVFRRTMRLLKALARRRILQRQAKVVWAPIRTSPGLPRRRLPQDLLPDLLLVGPPPRIGFHLPQQRTRRAFLAPRAKSKVRSRFRDLTTSSIYRRTARKTTTA
mmetsp:Transcript_4559/g.17954  ORF Transcript_4559/g.17954 Transcript_4559/m.17954 type:complete len:379 (-) Transcript_4559:229-1365(-)